MTTRDAFHDVMRQRRHWPKGSADHQYRTHAARKLVWMILGVPTAEWASKMQEMDAAK